MRACSSASWCWARWQPCSGATTASRRRLESDVGYDQIQMAIKRQVCMPQLQTWCNSRLQEARQCSEERLAYSAVSLSSVLCRCPLSSHCRGLLLALLELILEGGSSISEGAHSARLSSWMSPGHGCVRCRSCDQAEPIIPPCLVPCRPATVQIGEIRSSGTQTQFHCSSAFCARLTRRSRPGVWVLFCPWSQATCPTFRPATGEATAGQVDPSKTCTGPFCSLPSSVQQRNRAAVLQDQGHRRADQDCCSAGVP